MDAECREAESQVVALENEPRCLDGNPRRLFSCMEAITYKGDATNPEAIGRDKVHVASLATTTLDFSTLQATVKHDAGEVDISKLENVRSVKGTPDLQKVTKSSTDELHRLIASEFASLGIPFWEDRINQEHDFPHRMSLYALGFDRGSENIGEISRMRNAFDGRKLLMFLVIWCLCHGIHPIAKVVLKILDSFSWGADEDVGNLAPPTTYFNGMSVSSGVWRAPTDHDEIYNAVESAYGVDVAQDVAAHIPGRCIRGRWLAIDPVENLYIKGQVSSIGEL